MKFENNPILQEIDDNFVAIKNSLDDNAEAHEIVNGYIVKLAERLKTIEEYVVTVPTPDKILYKPEGCDEHLTLKENLDYIYAKLSKLESIISGDNE